MSTSISVLSYLVLHQFAKLGPGAAPHAWLEVLQASFDRATSPGTEQRWQWIAVDVHIIAVIHSQNR